MMPLAPALKCGGGLRRAVPGRPKVQGLDRSGKLIEIEGSELLARAFQHEIDHIDGILYINRLSRLKRELMKKKVEKVLSNKEA